MNPGDKRIIELEAQVDIMEYVISEINDIDRSIFRTRRPERRHVIEGIGRCGKAIRELYDNTNQELARELAEKDQAAKDDRADMKMEEERGG